MMISTKGRYALRVLIDMAEHQTDGYIPLKEIAKRQDISEKYLESIVSSPCDRAGECRTLSLWAGLNDVINKYLDQYTLADLLREDDGFDYVI